MGAQNQTVRAAIDLALAERNNILSRLTSLSN